MRAVLTIDQDTPKLTQVQANELESRKSKLYEMAQREFNNRNLSFIKQELSEISSKFPPCMHVFNIILKVNILLNDGEGIRRVIEGIQKEGLKPNTITYNLLISYYRNLGRMEDSMAVFERMIASGVQPNAAIYTTLIAGFSAKGNFTIAERLFKECQSKLEPDLHLFNAMISVYLAAGKPEDARLLSNSMIEAGLKPNHITYKVFLAELLENKQIEEAEKLFNLHLKDSPAMKPHDFGEVATKFFKAGAGRKGLEIFETTMKRFGRSSYLAYQQAIEEYSKMHKDKKIDGMVEECLGSKSLLAMTCHALLRHYVHRFLSSNDQTYRQVIKKVYETSIGLELQISPRIDLGCKSIIENTD